MTLEIALVQVAASEDPAVNRGRLGDLVAQDAELVVLPEAFARDFGAKGSDLSPFAEALDGPFVTALTRAARGRTVVAGMFERSEEPRPYNTVVVVNDDGVVASYRKIHLYDSFGDRESASLLAGALDQQPLFEVGDLRIGFVTCYDLRFPELTRRFADKVDVLVVPAAWVAGPRKANHWRTLLAARAIENVSYVAGAGQPEPDYCGHSMLVDPRGEVVAEAGPAEEVVIGTVDSAIVRRARDENPSLNNRRF